jgi:hypothetical protein
MADLARHLGVEGEMATFRGLGPARRILDAVVAGTAWH